MTGSADEGFHKADMGFKRSLKYRSYGAVRNMRAVGPTSDASGAACSKAAECRRNATVQSKLNAVAISNRHLYASFKVQTCSIAT